jgi:hypothetical protein
MARMAFLKYLKDNAMGVSGAGSAVLTALFASYTFGLSPRAIALWVGLPAVAGNFLANQIFRSNGNGKAPQQSVDKPPPA